MSTPLPTSTPLRAQDRPVVQDLSPANQPKLDPKGMLYILLSATGFGTIGLLAKLAYAHGLNPLSTQIWKVGGGALILWVWLLVQAIWQGRKPWRLPPPAMGQLPYFAIAPFLIGAIGYAAFSMSLFGAFSYATVGVTMLLFYTYPSFAALLRLCWTREPLNRWQAVCLGLTVAGCAITVDWQHQTSSPWGLMLGLGAAVGYAAYLLGSARVVSASSPVSSATWMLSGATTTMVAIALWHHSLVLPQNGIALGATVGLAIASTALPIVFLYAGLKRLDVVPAAILSTLEPVVAIALSVLFLAEPLWVGQIIGGLLILASAIMLQIRPSSGL